MLSWHIVFNIKQNVTDYYLKITSYVKILRDIIVHEKSLEITDKIINV